MSTFTIKTASTHLITWLALVALSCLVLTSPAWSATFDVTSTRCTGPNSIVEAIDNANALAGVDTISIQSGLEIQFVTCPIGLYDYAPYAGDVKESVIIEGNGATLQGIQNWVNTSGTLNPEGCPSEIPGVIVTSESPGFLRIGDSGADNSAIEVQISHLTANDLSAFARVHEGAQLDLRDVHLIDLQDAIRQCSRNAIDGDPGSSISMVDSTIENFKNYGTSATKSIWNAALAIGHGSLYVKDSLISKRFAGIPGGALYADSSDVTVVSSRFYNAGGFSFLGSADARSQASIVNSVIRIGAGTKPADRIYAGYNSDVEFQASTIVSFYGACTRCPPDDSQTMPLYAEGDGLFHLSETAIGAWGDTIPGALLFATRGGGYTADALTYVQPVAGQDAASLRILTGQPALLTDPPALPGEATGLTLDTLADYVEWTTPIAPGVLIDRVTDAGAGGINQLRDPFDGTVITQDALGNDRVDANGSRNIGAVQLSLAPSLHATPGDGEVQLDWTRPQDPTTNTIEGYDGYRSDLAIWVPFNSDPDVLTDGFNALTNGTEYGFKVRARYGPPFVGPFGPESNLVLATPLGPVEAPVLAATPGDAAVTLTWNQPDDGGRGITGYAIWYRPVGSVGWNPWPFVAGADTLQTVVSGLTNGQEWEFGIIATSPTAASTMATTTATPWPLPHLSYPPLVGVSENSLVSILPNVGSLSQTPLYLLQSGSLPAGLTLNNTTGEISGNPAPGSNATYYLTVLLSQAGLPSVFDVTADLTMVVVATPPDLRLHYPDIDVSAGTGPLDVAPTITGSQGGTLGYAMSTGDVLPDGLVLDPVSGYITGIPTTATDGFRGLSVEVTESGVTPTPRLAVSPLIVQIRPTLSYDPADGEVGDPITITPLVSPSTISGTFAITDGSLPLGLTLDPATGVVSGTPELPQFEVLTVTFTMTGGQTQQVSAVLGISVTDYTIDFSYPAATFTPSASFFLEPAVSGTKGITEYRIVSGSLPAGLALNPVTGVISGTPTEPVEPGPVVVELVDGYNTARAVVPLSLLFYQGIPQGIPTLDRIGLALLAAMMLGVGFFGMRRLV